MRADAPPEDCRVDFFGIGMPKSATTWMAACLDEHPQVTISEPKETGILIRPGGMWRGNENPHYLDWDWYSSRFDHANQDDVLGDFTIHMMHRDPQVPLDVKRYFPDAKFFVLLRDPVRRL